LAYLTRVDGRPAVRAFEQAEECYNAMNRAEAVLEKFSIRTAKDFENYMIRTRHLFNG
jgi:phage tail tape-measure protein